MVGGVCCLKKMFRFQIINLLMSVRWKIRNFPEIQILYFFFLIIFSNIKVNKSLKIKYTYSYIFQKNRYFILLNIISDNSKYILFVLQHENSANKSLFIRQY